MNSNKVSSEIRKLAREGKYGRVGLLIFIGLILWPFVMPFWILGKVGAWLYRPKKRKKATVSFRPKPSRRGTASRDARFVR